MKSVVIVGAGPCGLSALKEMLEAGLDAVLFEQSGQLGGLFSSDAMYPDLHLTMSNWAMAFSGFPEPTRLRYSSAEEYLYYLQEYARHFDLERHIVYNSEICDATLQDDRRWSLQIKQRRYGEEKTIMRQADALIVATGANQVPKSPPAGLAGFEGELIHSKNYGDSFKKKVAEKKLRVLVVGGGESGADVAGDLSDRSSNVTVWVRRTLCVGPRYLNAADEMPQVNANKLKDFPANGFLEAATMNRMSAAQNVYMYGMLRRVLWFFPVFNKTLSRLDTKSTALAPLRNDQATYVTKNQRMYEALHKKRLDMIVAPSISSRGQTCEFHMKDGTTRTKSFDAVVLCSGFNIEFPWIKLPGDTSLSYNPRSWFMHCFPPDVGHSLFFLGYARPHQGGIPVMAEMLSRYIALILRGTVDLPADYARLARRDETAEREYYSINPDVHTLVDYNSFLESLARRIGCEPRLPLSCLVAYNVHLFAVMLLALQYGLKDSVSLPIGKFSSLLLLAGSTASFFVLHRGLLIKWWFYPHWAVWYRQRGHGAVPGILDKTMGQLDLWQRMAITRGSLLLISWSVGAFYLQQLFSILLFVPSAALDFLGLRFSAAWGGLLRPKLFALHGCVWRISDLFHP